MPPIGPPPGMLPPVGMGMPNVPPGLNGFPHGQGPMIPNMMNRHPSVTMFPPPGSAQGFRPFPPPGMHVPNPMPLGRAFMEGAPGFGPGLPGIGAPNPMAGFGMGMPTHSRQTSGSFDKPAVEPPLAVPQAQPIARPTPIGRPASVKPPDENWNINSHADMDELASHLGSKALLEDADDMPEFPPINEARRTSLRTHGLPGTNPLGFSFPEGPGQSRDGYPPFGGVSTAGSAWGTPPIGFPIGGGPGWGNSPTSGMFSNGFMMGGPRQWDRERVNSIRRIVCGACKALAARQPSPDGYYDIADIFDQAGLNRSQADPLFTTQDIIQICDIVGDATNGGGSLEYKELSPSSGRFVIKFEEGGGPTAALGEIGSPLPGHSVPANSAFGATRPFPPLNPMNSPNY